MARFGLDRNIPKMKSDLERYGIKFDEWFFESSLHNSGYVKDTVEELHKLGWTYEKEGALCSRPPTSCASSTASRARRTRTSTSST